MVSELVTRGDLEVFLPPIGGQTVYMFGDVSKLGQPGTRITCRVHDECNGSDVFGSDICTCRPYLIHGIEEDRKSTRLNSSHGYISYAVFCLKKKKKNEKQTKDKKTNKNKLQI